jgi:hypothetical protein
MTTESEINQLRQKLQQQATEDDIEIYIAPRRGELGVQSPDMKSTGLRLWLENNGAKVVKDPGNGYLRIVPEGTDDE